MKKTILMALALATCLGYAPARAAEVVSSNVVGYSKLTMRGDDGYTMIANPFVEVGTGDLIGIADMFADDTDFAVAGTGVTGADNILVWNGSGYDTYYYRKPRTGTPYWTSGNTETLDTLPEGGGAFYISRSDSDKTLTISGEVRSEPQKLTIVPGYNLLENPFPVELSFDNFKFEGAVANTGVSSADNILVWNGTGYTTYYYRKPRTGAPFWTSGNTETTDKIAPYSGFFYVSRAESGTFEITIESPLSN